MAADAFEPHIAALALASLTHEALSSSQVSWDDLRAFMAVAVHGSMNKAGVALGESQPTIGRRIKRLEGVLVLTLLIREVNQVALTEAGRALLQAIAPMAGAAREIDAVVQAHQPRINAPVRLTTTTSMSMFLTRHLALLRAAVAPRELMILPSRRPYDIAGGEADIALRMRGPIKGSDLLTRKVGVIGFAFYGVAGHETLPVLMPSTQSNVSKQLGVAKLAARDRPLGPEIDEMHLRYVAVKSGVGVGTLPCWLGDQDSEIVRVYDVPELMIHDEIFLVRHLRTREDSAIDGLAQALVALLKAHRAILRG
jgi:DNA-binding transcriptional LysR family regulator